MSNEQRIAQAFSEEMERLMDAFADDDIEWIHLECVGLGRQCEEISMYGEDLVAPTCGTRSRHRLLPGCGS